MKNKEQHGQITDIYKVVYNVFMNAVMVNKSHIFNSLEH